MVLRALLLVTACVTAGIMTAVTLAQSETPGPDQMLIVGQVPAPPGTTVTVDYLDAEPPESVRCASGTTTEIPQSADHFSEFALLIERDCAGHLQDPKICWGDHACAFPGFSDRTLSADFEGETTLNVGLLEAREREPTTDPETEPATAVILPGTGSDHPSVEPTWMVWSLAALSLGVLLVSSSLTLHRREQH